MPRKAGDLPPLPRLIFLDTNVVQNLLTFGEHIYSNKVTPVQQGKLGKLSRRAANDVEALTDIMQWGRRYGWPLAVSERTLDELAHTPDESKRRRLLSWGLRIMDYFQRNTINEFSGRDLHQENVERRYIGARLGFLPQVSDRMLILDAIMCQSDVFLTMDYRSIWCFRREISKFGLSVMSPVELRRKIGPWAELLQ